MNKETFKDDKNITVKSSSAVGTLYLKSFSGCPNINPRRDLIYIVYWILGEKYGICVKHPETQFNGKR